MELVHRGRQIYGSRKYSGAKNWDQAFRFEICADYHQSKRRPSMTISAAVEYHIAGKADDWRYAQVRTGIEFQLRALCHEPACPVTLQAEALGEIVERKLPSVKVCSTARTHVRPLSDLCVMGRSQVVRHCIHPEEWNDYLRKTVRPLVSHGIASAGTDAFAKGEHVRLHQLDEVAAHMDIQRKADWRREQVHHVGREQVAPTRRPRWVEL